jgi:N-acetylneuraminate synthase
MVFNNSIFNNLFVLEIANNHLGSVNRGLEIIQQHAEIVRLNSVKAAFKLQFRDVESFIHKKHVNDDERYIKKTKSTKLSEEDFKILVKKIKNVGYIAFATPFDEKSVDLCIKFDFPIIKIASSDVNDWPLIEKVASTQKPVIISTGGVSEKDLDDVISFFGKKKIDLAINHCVSIYPTEEEDLNLSQIEFLRKKYPNHIIGFSTHEYNNWYSSMYMSYALGARTWERHVDIKTKGMEVSKYCSTPSNINEWFKAFNHSCIIYGNYSEKRRLIKNEEIKYLDNLVRGIYAKKNLKKGLIIDSKNFNKNFYMAIPLKKGQLSVREIINGEKLVSNIKKDQPLMINNLKETSLFDDSIKNKILNRGS